MLMVTLDTSQPTLQGNMELSFHRESIPPNTNNMLMHNSNKTIWLSSRFMISSNFKCSSNNMTLDCSSSKDKVLLLKVAHRVKEETTQSLVQICHLKELKPWNKWRGKSWEEKWSLDRSNKELHQAWTILQNFKRRIYRISLEIWKLPIILPKMKISSLKPNCSRFKQS